MKYNFLLPRKIAEESCEASSTGKKKHVWVPTGDAKANSVNQVAVAFNCKRCSKFLWHVMLRKIFELHKKNIEKFNDEVYTNQQTHVGSEEEVPSKRRRYYRSSA